MSSGNCLMMQFYWGGKIVYAGGSISYDPPLPKKVMFLTERVNFDGLVDIVYNMMELNRNTHKINLIFRNCMQNGVFGATPLVDDNGVDGMYFLKANSAHGTEIYIEVESIVDFKHDHMQNLHIASLHGNQDPNIHGSEDMDVVGTIGLYESQLSQIDCENVPSARRSRRKGNGRRMEVNRPSSSHPIMDTEPIINYGVDMDTCTVGGFGEDNDIEFVDVDVDSEPEPDDDSDDDNPVYGSFPHNENLSESQFSRGHQDHNTQWTFDEGPQLRYKAGVDAALTFDPLDACGVEKLKLWNERTKELELG